MNKKDLISDIDQSHDIPSREMWKAVWKKESNNLAEELNTLADEGDKIKITPLTEEEIKLCEQFEQYVKLTREPTQ